MIESRRQVCTGASVPLLAYEERVTSRSGRYSPLVRMGREEIHYQGLADLIRLGWEDWISP
jgi:hypothetical protein